MEHKIVYIQGRHTAEVCCFSNKDEETIVNWVNLKEGDSQVLQDISVIFQIHTGDYELKTHRSFILFHKKGMGQKEICG